MRRHRGSLKAEGFNEVKTVSPIFRLPQLCLAGARLASKP